MNLTQEDGVEAARARSLFLWTLQSHLAQPFLLIDCENIQCSRLFSCSPYLRKSFGGQLPGVVGIPVVPPYRTRLFGQQVTKPELIVC